MIMIFSHFLPFIYFCFVSKDAYYNKSVEYNGCSSETLKARSKGAQIGTNPDPNSAIECSDVVSAIILLLNSRCYYFSC
jgi:hypothetical protein